MNVGSHGAMLIMIVMNAFECFATNQNVKEWLRTIEDEGRVAEIARNKFSKSKLYSLHEWLANEGIETWNKHNIVFKANINEKLKIIRIEGFDEEHVSVSQEFAIDDGEITSIVVYHGRDKSETEVEETDAIEMEDCGLHNIYFAFQCSVQHHVYNANKHKHQTRYYVSLNAYSDANLQQFAPIIKGYTFSVEKDDKFQLFELN